MPPDQKHPKIIESRFFLLSSGAELPASPELPANNTFWYLGIVVVFVKLAS